LSIKNGKFRLNKKSVLVVDEAGMVGSRDMEKLMAHVERAGARIRLVGDAKQLSAVEYGNAFVEISQRTEVASLTEIMRQKTEWMRGASEKFAVHDISGLKDYHDHGHVHLADTTKDAQLAIVEKWKAHRTEQPDQSRIVLSHTNSARLELNDMMRSELKKEGKLQVEVDVIARSIVSMAVGEQVMFTAPDKKMGVKNGTTGVISEISLGGTISVALASGKTAKFNANGRGKENGNEVDYAYAVTVHKSQGMTVDQSFVLAENSMTKDNLYVAMTRHKHDVELVASAEQFSTIDDLVKGLDRVGQKEFSAEEGKDWTSARRPEDSEIGQMLADINAEKVLQIAAQQASYKEIAANLEAKRVLDYVSKPTVSTLACTGNYKNGRAHPIYSSLSTRGGSASG
jgi:ATP-dependent exoDNAse (exonuclease V) alpha subunit